MSKSDCSLIKKDIGEIIYEHVLVCDLPNGIIIGVAERNLYLDENNKVNLCAYWNIRKPGTYEFIPEYNFYITKGRICMDVYFNLGTLRDTSKIIKKFSSLDEASVSEYYKHFCWMKNEIDKAAKKRKAYLLKYDEYKWGTMWVDTRMDKEGGVYEWFCKKRNEYVLLEIDLLKNEWILTTCKYRIGVLKNFFDNFYEIDKKELHLLTYHDELDVKNINKSSPYFPIVKKAKEELGLIGGVFPGKKNYEDFKYIEYWTYSYNLPPTKIIEKTKKRLEINGKILISKMNGKGKILRKENRFIKPHEAVECYKNLAKFLSSGRLKKNCIYDDQCGILRIKYKDGHLEKYDRGLSYKTKYLNEIIRYIF